MRIGIIGAMDVEVEHLKELAAKEAALEPVKLGQLEFFCGKLSGCEVVIFQCGVGMVNAAVATQVITGHFHVDAVINTGVGGSLDASIEIGEIVIGTDAVNHVMDVCNLGYQPGQTPGCDVVAFPCDETLRSAAKRAAGTLGITTQDGRIASGDRFVRDTADKERIRSTFAASCCEMEGAAIAQVCWTNKVPFVIARAISDKADGTDHIDYPTFEAKAAEDCARLTVEILRELA